MFDPTTEQLMAYKKGELIAWVFFFSLFSDFQWVQGDVCEVQLMVYNPMPYELRVENMVSDSRHPHLQHAEVLP